MDLVEHVPTEPALLVMWLYNYVAARNLKIVRIKKIHIKTKSESNKSFYSMMKNLKKPICLLVVIMMGIANVLQISIYIVLLLYGVIL